MKLEYQQKKKVVQDHLDDLNHVNNVVYLQWAQDIATEHWNLLQKRVSTSDIFWVVLRHEIDYKGQAFLNDELLIKTWIGETKGITSVRNVEILKDEKTLVFIKTTWCLVDAISNKPKRISEPILQILGQK